MFISAILNSCSQGWVNSNISSLNDIEDSLLTIQENFDSCDIDDTESDISFYIIRKS
jgi:hypothetical protein